MRSDRKTWWAAILSVRQGFDPRRRHVNWFVVTRLPGTPVNYYLDEAEIYANERDL